MNLHVFTSRAREEADFQGIRFLTGAARWLAMLQNALIMP